MSRAAKRQPCSIVNLSASQQAVVSKTGVWLMKGGRVWTLNDRETQTLVATLQSAWKATEGAASDA